MATATAMTPATTTASIHGAITIMGANSFTTTILATTLQKYPDSAFSRVLMGDTYDFLLAINPNSIIADIDDTSLSYILNHLRGYPYFPIQDQFLSKVYFDAIRLKITTLIAEIKGHVGGTMDNIPELSEVDSTDVKKLLNQIDARHTAKDDTSPAYTITDYTAPPLNTEPINVDKLLNQNYFTESSITDLDASINTPIDTASRNQLPVNNLSETSTRKSYKVRPKKVSIN
jgi:hypothetical protein